MAHKVSVEIYSAPLTHYASSSPLPRAKLPPSQGPRGRNKYASNFTTLHNKWTRYFRGLPISFCSRFRSNQQYVHAHFEARHDKHLIFRFDWDSYLIFWPFPFPDWWTQWFESNNFMIPPRFRMIARNACRKPFFTHKKGITLGNVTSSWTEK